MKSSLENSMKKSDFILNIHYQYHIITAKGQKLTIKTNSASPELVSELANTFLGIYDTDAKSDVNQTPFWYRPLPNKRL